MILKRTGYFIREELQYYPKLDKKKKSDKQWIDAVDNDDFFGDDQMEGFMGLEVFHGIIVNYFFYI